MNANTRITDPALPGINTALDVETIQELLQKALPEGNDNVELTELKIIDVQYKPGESCKLLYQVKARNRKRNRTIKQLVSAILLPSGSNWPAVPQEVLNRYKVDEKTVLSAPLISLPEIQMMMYAFPVDPALPWLSETLEQESMEQHMQQNWEWRNVHIRRATIRPIGFTPQARAAIFLELLTETKDTKEPEMRRLIGKIHGYKPAALLFSGAWALWRAVNHKIRIAPPVGYVSSLHLTLQEQVQGERLTEFAHTGSFIKPVRMTARSIAEIHKLSLPLNSVRTAAKEAAVIQRWKSILVAICPEQSGRIEKLSGQISEELQKRIVIEGPVHGDFHPANVMWDDKHVTLVDLDDLSYGDPFVDVGRFLASLRVSALRVSSKVSALNNVGEAFLQQYFKLSSTDERRARLFEAASLLIAACAPFRLQRPGWKESAVMLIDETERVWNTCRAATTGVAQTVPVEPGTLIPDAARWFTDGVYMRTVLDPHIRKIYGAEVVTCRAESNNDQEVSYELHGWRGEDKWTITLRGTVWLQRGATAVVRRLEKLNAAMVEPSTTVLPRPVVFLRPLSLIIWEPPTGRSFKRLMRSTNELEQEAAGVARALATIHRTSMEISGQISQEEEIRALRADVEQVKEEHNTLFNQVNSLLKQLEPRIASVPWQYAPVLRKVHPKDVLFQGDRIAFASLQKLTRSHPYIDAAHFLAHVTLIGLRRNKIDEAQKAGNSFRKAYVSNGVIEEDLALFESAALLRLACRLVKRHSGTREAEYLLNSAVARFASAGSKQK